MPAIRILKHNIQSLFYRRQSRPYVTSTRRTTRVIAWLGLIALLLGNLLQPAALHAQATPNTKEPTTATPSLLNVTEQPDALHLDYRGIGAATASGQFASPTMTYGGYILPMETILVEMPATPSAVNAGAANGTTNVLNAVAVQSITSTPFAGTLTPAPTYAPPALDFVPTPINTPHVESALPTAPIFVMAEGWQRNRHLAVLGFSAIYQDASTGELRMVESMSATVTGAHIAAADALLANVTASPDDAALFAPLATQADAPGPTNPFANRDAIKISVTEIGIQQISGQQLAEIGLASPKASKLRLFYLGQELPLHIIDANSNDVLNSDDYLRFYAPAAGDAQNPASVYWLAMGSTDGIRMSQRDVASAGAPIRNTAHEVGHYQQNVEYITELAGTDGDNWFQADLRAEGTEASFTVTLTHRLPLNAALPTVLSLNLTPYSIGPYGSTVTHRLRLSASDFSQTNSWTASLSGPRPYDNKLITETLNSAADIWTITLLPESSGRAVKVDRIDYLLPVQLNFNNKGAVFQGIEGNWRYQLSNAPTSVDGGRALYDITEPTQPQRLTIPGGSNFVIQDGPTIHRYLLTGSGTFFTPSLQRHSPVNLGGSGAAHTIYIAPANFHAPLHDLVELRKQQGYQVRVVDVQAIYDAWSYGMVDPQAIRSFLRYAAGNWSPAPIAAVLVGDATSDPHDYLGTGNPNVIPAYVANVDPWIKWVPCDSCFGQLDGDDPTADYLIDIWIGRFPVIDEAELTTVVNKIIGYETNTEERAVWRATSLQIADDDVRPDNTVDSAGPFVGSAEHIISLMPTSMRHLRNYFSAATSFDAVPTIYDRNGTTFYWRDTLISLTRWFVDDADVALQNSINLMSSGVGMVTYTGHSNHWQWARITKDDDENRWLFGLVEVLFLQNLKTPFISMSMTCYSSQFNQVAARHYTIDERLFLHGGGGAVATWGPTGFSIVPAHDTLQEGFHTLLWKSPPLQAKLGALLEAGYQAVYTSGNHYDVTKTFALFGDPLTSARVMPVNANYMPVLHNESTQQ